MTDPVLIQSLRRERDAQAAVQKSIRAAEDALEAANRTFALAAQVAKNQEPPLSMTPRSSHRRIPGWNAATLKGTLSPPLNQVLRLPDAYQARIHELQARVAMLEGRAFENPTRTTDTTYTVWFLLAGVVSGFFYYFLVRFWLG